MAFISIEVSQKLHHYDKPETYNFYRFISVSA